MIYTGELDSLKRMKDDVREVKEGFECGIKLKNYKRTLPRAISWSSSKSRKLHERCKAGLRLIRQSPAETGGAFHLEGHTTCDTSDPFPTAVSVWQTRLQRDLSELIRELKDPRVGMVTLNAVDVTPDYAHAKVFFSLLIGDPVESEAALNEAAGFLRNGLFKRLQIHTVPTCTSALIAPPSVLPTECADQPGKRKPRQGLSPALGWAQATIPCTLPKP